MDYLKNIFLHNFGDKNTHRNIFLESAVREVDIGIHDYEIGNPQRIQFDIFVAIEGDNIVNDDIGEVLNYEYLIDIIDSKIGKRFSLLETLANEILDDVLFPTRTVGATVIISKLDILDSGNIGCSVSRLK
jgi:dihydroneopterin aldolase|tara:strand:- start:14366 stop:14758 length:393 start_codon:yes stop_codon:yes gene_type:complete